MLVEYRSDFISLVRVTPVPFRSRMRTKRPGIQPSEWVVATALQNNPPEFLADAPQEHIIEKFMRENIDLDTAQGLRLAA